MDRKQLLVGLALIGIAAGGGYFAKNIVDNMPHQHQKKEEKKEEKKEDKKEDRKKVCPYCEDTKVLRLTESQAAALGCKPGEHDCPFCKK